jgi:hypothetical protein
MPGHRLIHESALLGANALLDLVAPALRPEERRDYFDEAYRICVALLEAYEQQMQREAARLCKPSCN